MSIQVILVLYLLVIAGIGVYAAKFNKNMSDFLLAGRRLGLAMCAFTLAATHFGGGFVLGMGEGGYGQGYVQWWFGIGGGLGLILVGFLAPKMRELAFYTVPDYLEHRYGSRTLSLLGASFSLFSCIGILAAQIVATRGALSIIGITPLAGTIIASLIFIIYTAFGGLWAATLTDFVQIIVAAVGVVLAFIISLRSAGGWSVIVEKVSNIPDLPAGYFNIFGTFDWTLIAGLFLPILLMCLIDQSTYQRFLSAKTPKIAQQSCTIAGIFILVFTIFPTASGIIAKSINPNLENASEAIPFLISDVFPAAVAGLFIAAIIAAIMSTADSILTAATSHITNDFYVKSLKMKGKEEDPKKLLFLSRFWVVVVGVVSIFMALVIPGIINLLMISYTIFTAGVFMPVVGGFLWKKGTIQGAFSSIAVASIMVFLSYFNVIAPPIPVEVIGILTAFVVYVIVSLATYKPQEV
ncbi:MAG: sodium:solute symporter family protein [Peptococcaceae bacterium]|nr:sodium:solute symporter family protein [Peptococcaceae bacterium]